MVTWEDLKCSLILAKSSHSQLILAKFAKYRGTTATHACYICIFHTFFFDPTSLLEMSVTAWSVHVLLLVSILRVGKPVIEYLQDDFCCLTISFYVIPQHYPAPSLCMGCVVNVVHRHLSPRYDYGLHETL